MTASYNSSILCLKRKKLATVSDSQESESESVPQNAETETSIKLNLEPHTIEDSFIFNSLKYVFEFGRLFLIIPFKMRNVWLESRPGTKNSVSFEFSRKRKIACNLFILFMAIYTPLRSKTQGGVVVNLNIMNYIKYGIYIPMLLYTLFGFKNLTRNLSGWEEIVEAGTEVEDLMIKSKFSSVRLMTRNKGKILGLLLTMYAFIGCCYHHIILSEIGPDWGLKQSKRLLNMFIIIEDDDLISLHPLLQNFISMIAFTLEIFCWNIWFYFDTIRFTLITITWIYCYTLNSAWKYKEIDAKDLNQVIDIHLKINFFIIKLNGLLSSCTLFAELSILFFRFYCISYIIGGFDQNLTSFNNIAFMVYSIRTLPLIILAADVNSKAYEITDWIQDIFASPNNKYNRNEKNMIMMTIHNSVDVDTDYANFTTITKSINPTKWSLFLAQIYNSTGHSTIGFKGQNFFTITYSFLSGIASLLLTYCIVLLQFIKEEPKIIEN